jgi:UDP-N-acetylmuramoyl-tripeptide--D-alanyl-D-alanine ligase
MRLHEAADAIGATAQGADGEFSGVSTDSRSLPPGCLFIALRGERFDGHTFVEQALAQGAAAVMVADDYDTAHLAPHSVLVVDDTRLALGRLAAWQRRRMPAKLLAITGSNGKTTVKEMVAAIASAHAGPDAVLATAGNFNNDIGMPLTLLRLAPSHQFAVIEMGMNHPGELDYLSRLAQPDVALVNNALRAHLEGLGSVAAVARAKGEIYNGLKPDGIALYNADDPNADIWRALTEGKSRIGFGLAQGEVRADCRLRALGADLNLHTPAGTVEISLQVPGEHNARNAVAAAAAAQALGIPLEAIARGLASFNGVKGRLQSHACILGARLIDDTYNANPDSVTAAIRVLAAQSGTRLLVLGDMGELGANAAQLHTEIGLEARQAGIDRLLCLGEMSLNAAEAFGAGAMHFERIEELLAEVENALAPGITVLVKGSRFMKMERVVKSLQETQTCS